MELKPCTDSYCVLSCFGVGIVYYNPSNIFTCTQLV